MRRNRRQSGFSLVELAAGTVMVATALLGATAAIVSSASLTKEVARTRASARAASSIMEEVRATDFAQLVTNFDGRTFDVSGGESGLETGSASVSVTLVDNGSSQHQVYEIIITVSFDGATDGQTQTIVTYASDRVAGSSLGTTTTTTGGTGN